MPKDDSGRQDPFYMTVVRLTVNCLQQQTSDQAFTVLTSELMREFSCERVSVGNVTGHHAHVFALSNSARFDDKTVLIKAISAAMDEAIAQDQVIVYRPENQDDGFIVKRMPNWRTAVAAVLFFRCLLFITTPCLLCWH